LDAIKLETRRRSLSGLRAQERSEMEFLAANQITALDAATALVYHFTDTLAMPRFELYRGQESPSVCGVRAFRPLHHRPVKQANYQ